jgi:hypothetical protein
MYPHERSLVKRLEGKPFALLGINSDRSKDDLKKVLEKEQITWRSWWDGGGTEGPIQTRWNIRGWPTVYILDHNGIIRYRDLRDREIDEAVDKLLKEMTEDKAERPIGNLTDAARRLTSPERGFPCWRCGLVTGRACSWRYPRI